MTFGFGGGGTDVTDPAYLIAALRADPAGSVILTDFDGTIAPIVVDPAAARPFPGAVEILHRLAMTYGRVAVVSGRPAEFLVEQLDLVRRDTALLAVGLYGMERASAGGQIETLAADSWRATVERAIEAAEEQAPDGVFVERKGLSLALHWRRAVQSGANEGIVDAASRVAEELAARYGLEARYGRMSVELLPPLGANKGSAVRDLCSGFERAFYAGDDRADLDAFATLDSLGAEGLVGVKVAVASKEAPSEVAQQADFVVDGPAGMVDLLEQLAI